MANKVFWLTTVGGVILVVVSWLLAALVAHFQLLDRSAIGWVTTAVISASCYVVWYVVPPDWLPNFENEEDLVWLGCVIVSAVALIALIATVSFV